MTDGSLELLDELWGPVVAVTAAHEGCRSGLISTTALLASLVPEAPRLSVQLAPWNLTHDLALGSGAFAVHLLPADPVRALPLVERLGFRSGREADKLRELPVRPGVTGSPILLDAVGYAEAAVARTLELGDFTIVVGDVVAGERLTADEVLTVEHLRQHTPPAWHVGWAERLERDREEARRRRGLGARPSR